MEGPERSGSKEWGEESSVDDGIRQGNLRVGNLPVRKADGKEGDGERDEKSEPGVTNHGAGNFRHPGNRVSLPVTVEGSLPAPLQASQ